jgi:hypothetical protein
MARTEYLAVRNWDKFQHYKDGRPLTWIKFHTALLDDPELRALPVETRLLWDQLLLVAGRTDNCIRRDYEWIAACTNIDIECARRGVQMLVKGAWLLRFQSRQSLDKARARARSREKRREEEIKSARARESKTPDPARAIETMIRNGAITDPVDLAAEIAGYHLDDELATRLRGMLQ